MKMLRCTWCNKEICDNEDLIRDMGDPFCSQLCLDLQLEDDALFAEAKEVLGDGKIHTGR